jgi:hypothetical protein
MAWLAVLKSFDAVEKELDPIAFFSLDLGSFVQKVRTCLYFSTSLGSFM